ncbi:LAGLIDADG family homing endonuclease [Clostridium weizhouense]|uniref:Homing endonuclease LAGLIDADG domain-containing protein n=1 Tax=Clostridium weizhouense TaxID=2859781 RepID=A0ABS7AJ87_9CLOT|nr:hypothetical protein [Clostridium weizhouense]MBW6408702.1 hypothetical protein [Clostridium weizhouense]
MQLNPNDRNILEEFLKDINFDRPICVNKKGYISISISSTKMANDLIKLGCIPRKSLVLKFPNENMVSKNLINHFIRGYMDGDGCISTYMKSRKQRKSLNFICEIKFIGTYQMLYGIKKFFDSEKEVLINSHSPNSYQISFPGKKYRDAIEFLYEDATIYMKRKKDKWDKFKRYMEYQENRRSRNEDIRIVKLDKNANYIGAYTLQELKKEFDLSSIKKCCKYEKHKSHKGFLWLYLREYNEYLKYGINIRSKFGYTERDINGRLIKVWGNLREAATFYDVTFQSIERAINGKYKTCCGFIRKNM